MTFKAKIVCDGPCFNEREVDTQDPYSVDVEIDMIANEKEWLFYDENDSHYCPECAPIAAEQLGLEYKKQR
ncbi:MAG: hypothetical protein V5786_10370 [Psychromonas sp.]